MKGKYTSKSIRQSPALLRNEFSYSCSGTYGMPVIKKCDVDIKKIKLIGSDKIRSNETAINMFKTVHFFSDDNKLERYYNHPERYLDKLAQYTYVLTPDYSLYPEMATPIQVYNTFKNRWCGAYWQEHGLTVIPSVSWSNDESFNFCFEGLERGATVAISTLGNLKSKMSFLNGYFEMIKRIEPKHILCFGKIFTEMGNEAVSVDYSQTTGR